VEDVYLFDRYKDSLAYRVIYRDLARTLTDQEVNARHETVVKALETKLNARIRR
jgi:phenylalanyl-tRNA synthetase beta subunit